MQASRLLARAAAAVLALGWIGAGVLPAHATEEPPAVTAAEVEARLLELANEARAVAGVAPLVAREDVGTIARGWSGVMAEQGALSHNDAYFSEQVREQLNAGTRAENVAYASGAEHVHQVLMDSPPHRANLLDARVSVVGMGAVLVNGSWWVTQDFLEPRTVTTRAAAPATAASVAAAPPPPPTTPAPAPTPTPPTTVAAAPVTTVPVVVATTSAPALPNPEASPTVPVDDATEVASSQRVEVPIAWAASAIVTLLGAVALAVVRVRPGRRSVLLSA